MNFNKKYLFNHRFLMSLVVLFISLDVTAQAVNTGEFTINPGTVVSVVSDFDNQTSGELMHDGDLYIYSNFNNDGLIGFLTEGLTRFQGKNTQKITGEEESFFFDVLFNNASSQPAFELAGGISIANEGTFTSGIVDNDNHGGTISFERLATAITPSDASHVDGTVIKRGDTGFNFPIGDGGFYRYGGISAPNDATDIYTGKYFLENSDNLYSHNSKQERIQIIDNTEYWIIDKKEDNEHAEYVTLTWDEDTTPLEIYAEPVEINIVRWDEAEGQWVDEGGVVDENNKTVTTIAEAYGIFTLARVGIVEPCGSFNVYNALSPNNDGLNDYFKIDVGDDDCYDRVGVKIFNRWGVEVFQADSYGDGGKVFRGYSEGRATIAKGELLPAGTYFYILTLEFTNIDGQQQYDKRNGYLYLTY